MKVSVVLTCYKQEKFIEEAILSVINQSYDNRELLIGDDSPNDNCRNIILKYTKKYPQEIHAWHHKENKGIIRNMQFLIDKATNSEFIAILEGDDYWHKDYLKEKINIFVNNECYLVFNDLIEIDSCSNITKRNYLKSGGKTEFYKNKILDLNEVLTSSKVLYHSRSTIAFRKCILKNVLIEIPGLSPYNLISDYNFFLRVCSKFPIYGTEKELTYYRWHGANTSKINNLDLMLDLYKLSKIYRQEKLISEKTFNEVSTRCLLVLVAGYIRIILNTSIYWMLKNFFVLIFQKFK